LEKKFFDATFAFSAGTAAGQFPSSDGWIEDLSDMTQGVGITQRVGDRIAPTSLEFLGCPPQKCHQYKYDHSKPVISPAALGVISTI